MKAKILIIVGAVLVILVGAFLYLNNRNRTLSPPGETSATAGDLTVKVTYSRPSVRDRLIFGEAEEGALLPYGVYWRLGANEPTDLEVSKGFMFGDAEMEAGKYVIYAIPRKGEMELRLSSDLRMWGYSEPDYTKDLATTLVRVNPADHTEQFTIEAVADGSNINLVFSWSTHTWTLPIEGR
ncbi:MAG: hypothetical protein Tsb0034_01090 [Ekhidna sp.]